MADTAHLVKTNSYGFFGYVVPGTVVTLYALIVVSYLWQGSPLYLLRLFHNDTQISSTSTYEYISFLAVFIVAAYISGHLSEACASMIYDRFYMRRIYGHPLRKHILGESTDRRETDKNFYRASIDILYASALIYFVFVYFFHAPSRDKSINIALELALCCLVAAIIAIAWSLEGKRRDQEKESPHFAQDCEATISALSRPYIETNCAEAMTKLSSIKVGITNDRWMRNTRNSDNNLRALALIEKSAMHIDNFIISKHEEEIELATAEIQDLHRLIKKMSARNHPIVLAAAYPSYIAEFITNKFVDDERQMSSEIRSLFKQGFKNVFGVECNRDVGSEINRLPMWYVVETQNDLSSFVVKYRAQAAMMCNISGAFIICSFLSIFAMCGTDKDKYFALIGLFCLLISTFTSLRYFHVHSIDYVKTLIYSFIIASKANCPGVSEAQAPPQPNG